MTIDGTNISVYGLKVESMLDDCSLPARKMVLTEPGFEAKDLVFQEKVVKMVLFGTYSNLATLRTNIEGLKALIRTELVHTFARPSHGLIFNGVIANGIKVDSANTTAVLTFSINIVE